MENWRENFSMISKLKTSGNRRDALSARLIYERLFGAANFHPAGVSQRALVCIRKINAPPIENSRRFGGSAFDWESGIRGTVEKYARHAFRPVRETVPAQAESVIFEDRAELLACLARDWLDGSLNGCWWWRALFPKLLQLLRTETIAEIWLARAEFAPSAFAILTKNGTAEKFVRRLASTEVFALLHEIARIFGLDKLSAALTEPFEKKTPAASKFVKKPSKRRFREDEKFAAPAESNALFGRLIPESQTSNLSFERQILLETALLLVRAPRIARSPEYAERVFLLRENHEFAKTVAGKKAVVAVKKIKPRAEQSQVREIAKKTSRDTGETAKSRPRRSEKDAFVFSGERETEKSVENSAQPPIASRKKRGRAPKTSTGAKKNVPAPSSKLEFKAVRDEEINERTARKTEPRDPLSSRTETPEKAFKNFFEPVETDVEMVFQTRFGGVFYLLNLGLYLGLYRDFTEASPTEIDLNIWDFVALLSLEFLGERIKSDAVWDFLKLAATRENERDFGREFEGARDWRIPPAWLETFSGDERTWILTKQRRRLVVRHPAGFNIIDIRRRGRIEKQVADELEIYRETFAQTIDSDAKSESLPESKSWLENLAEYLRERLFQALGIDTTPALNAVLFEQGARVAVSATHLEITFALADLPIEVRLAGLDRNPAWIPAAGKYVYFHFV
jgi:hypothetical protein